MALVNSFGGMVVLLQDFRSVSILLGDKVSNVNNKVSHPIGNWLHRFDEWYKAETGIKDGNNLHLLYKRGVTIFADRLLANISELENLLISCLECDFYVSLKISLGECHEFYSALEKLTENFKNLLLIIDASDPSLTTLQGDFVISLVESMTLKKIHLTLIGSVSFWLNSGISRSQVVGETIYEIMPNLRERKRRFWGDYNPCTKWFGFVINYDGLIYPCMGLVGIESSSIGTIQQPLPVVWETIKHHSLNLEQLASQGPKLDLVNVASEGLNFRSICEAHRYKIQSKEKKNTVQEKI
ncbi:MAG: hypothetical protein F6K22_11445 [Okeania sp. SIO2F4]|uniref:hypothetical protein n=1 Tax=Okeania sp. SIO2F4 TaxID=2607790 RepID=UPI00142984EF|nr:hypothetical protein [Okeania sp. SIO2F4]NES03402.1 hypothetical protein [Okeania sp. SIO2F4]